MESTGRGQAEVSGAPASPGQPRPSQGARAGHGADAPRTCRGNNRASTRIPGSQAPGRARSSPTLAELRHRGLRQPMCRWPSGPTAQSSPDTGRRARGRGVQGTRLLSGQSSAPPLSESHRREERTTSGPGASAPPPAPCPAAQPLWAWHPDPKLRAGSPPPGTAAACRPRSSQDRLPGRSGWPPWGLGAELTRRKDCPAPGPRFPSVSLS